MIIDTHAHLYLEAFEDDLSDVLKRARAAGVDRVVMPAIDVASVAQAIALCERYEGLYAMAALHPSETKDATDAEFEQIIEYCDHPAVIAVGETGLDYYWDRSFDAQQHDFLRRHIRLATEKELPIVFHNREAFGDLVRILEEEIATGASVRGIFHCFTGTASQAEKIDRMGFLVGLGGIVTFKNSDLGEAVQEIPLRQIVLETDAPYLAPTPHRGKRNEPAYTRLVAERIASLKGETLEDVAETTTRTAEKLFGLG